MSSAASSFNKTVFRATGIIPHQPQNVLTVSLGSIVRIDPSTYETYLTEFSIPLAQTEAKPFATDLILASEHIHYFRLGAQVQGSQAAAGVGVSFTADGQRVMYASTCTIMKHETSESRLAQLLQEKVLAKRDSLSAFKSYAVVTSLITAKKATMYLGDKDQVAVLAGVHTDTAMGIGSITVGLDGNWQTNAQAAFKEIPDAIVGYHIRRFDISMIASKVEVEEGHLDLPVDGAQPVSNKAKSTSVLNPLEPVVDIYPPE